MVNILMVIEKSLGEKLFEKVSLANEIDLELYAYALRKFEGLVNSVLNK